MSASNSHSAKEKVRKKWPEAYCAKGVFRFTVWRDPSGRKNLGSGWSALTAWKDAARRMSK